MRIIVGKEKSREFSKGIEVTNIKKKITKTITKLLINYNHRFVCIVEVVENSNLLHHHLFHALHYQLLVFPLHIQYVNQNHPNNQATTYYSQYMIEFEIDCEFLVLKEVKKGNA